MKTSFGTNLFIEMLFKFDLIRHCQIQKSKLHWVEPSRPQALNTNQNVCKDWYFIYEHMWFVCIYCLARSMGSYPEPEARGSPLGRVCIWVFGKAVCDSLGTLVWGDRWVRILGLGRTVPLSAESAYGYLASPWVIRWELSFGEIDRFVSRAWGARVPSRRRLHLSIWQGRVWFTGNFRLARSMGSDPEINCFLNTFRWIDFQ